MAIALKLTPLEACRLDSKLDKLSFTQLHILNRLEALEGLEIARNDIGDTIKSVQDDILSL
jgi:hypothetical protein